MRNQIIKRTLLKHYLTRRGVLVLFILRILYKKGMYIMIFDGNNESIALEVG